MKTFIKENIPGAKFLWRKLYNFYKKHIYSKNTSLVFQDKFRNNAWGSSESISGLGSELRQTQNLLTEMPLIFEKYKIKNIIDLPCGDFNWFRFLNYKFDSYIGADIVEELIELNNKKYGEFGKFIKLNLLKDRLPAANLILCRDCLVHFSYNDIRRAIKNIKKSNIEYILTTTYISREVNGDILTGNWRPLNLQLSPFSFPEPIEIIIENSQEANGTRLDKALAMWRIKDLTI